MGENKGSVREYQKKSGHGANKSLSECILWCSWGPPRYVGNPSCDVSNRQEHQKQALNIIFSSRLLVCLLPLVRVVLLVFLVGASFPSLLCPFFTLPTVTVRLALFMIFCRVLSFIGYSVHHFSFLSSPASLPLNLLFN